MSEQDSQQFKRNIAFKMRIGDILIAKPIMNGDKFSCLELGNKKINRVNIIGNIIDKYESQGERQYVFSKVDDGSGQISLKAFGDDVKKLKLDTYTQGQTILCIGSLRNFNNETYIFPEIIKEMSTEYLLVRKLELEKERNKISSSSSLDSSNVVAVKDKILKLIKDSESQSDAGIEIDKIILEVRETTPDLINQEIKRLLEEGIIFEPRPGKVRWLG